MSINSQQLESVRRNPDSTNAFIEVLQGLKSRALQIYDNPDDRAQTLAPNVRAQQNRQAVIDLFDRLIAEGPEIMKAVWEGTPDAKVLDKPNVRPPDAGSREDLRQKLGREPVLAQGGVGGGEDVPSERRTFGVAHTHASLKAQQDQDEKDRLAREKQAEAQKDVDRETAQRNADFEASQAIQNQQQRGGPKSSFDDDRAEQKAEEEAARKREADKNANQSSGTAHEQNAADQAAVKKAAPK